jgi:multiple sugar transport system substrate-binding protein
VSRQRARANLSRRGLLRVGLALGASGAAASLLSACGADAPPTPAPKAPEKAAAPAPADKPAAPADKPAAAAGAPAAQTAGTTGAAGGFDWQRFKGAKLSLGLNKHPFTESLIPQLTRFSEQTGIEVRYNILPEAEYNQKILVDLSTGAGEYDMYMTGPSRNWIYARSGWQVELDPYLQDKNLTPPDYDLGDFFDRFIFNNRWDKRLLTLDSIGKGPLWSIPVMVEADSVAYRKDLFEKAGIAKPPETIDDLVEAARKTTDKANNVYGVIERGLRGGGASGTGFTSTFKGYGGRVFDDALKCTINSEVGVMLADKWAKMMKESGPPGWTSITWYEGKETVTAGKAAIYYDADFFAASYEEPGKSPVAGKMGYSLGLHAPDKPRFARIWTWALGISNASKAKEAAWTLIAWSTTKQALTDATLKYRNYNPTRKSVFDNAEVQAEIKKWGGGSYFETVQENYAKYVGLPVEPSPDVTIIGQRWDQALHEIWSGEKQAKPALDAAAAEIDAAMKKAGYTK